MARVEGPKDWDAMFAELNSKQTSDRVAILVGVSLVEYALERVIETRLRKPANETETEKLFNDQNGILGTLSEKIWGAYFLKIIGPKVRHDLDLIRRIRNIAAHDPNHASFVETDGIAQRCKALEMADDATVGPARLTNMKRRFLATVQFFAANLLMRAGDTTAEVTESFAQLAPDLDK